MAALKISGAALVIIVVAAVVRFACQCGNSEQRDRTHCNSSGLVAVAALLIAIGIGGRFDRLKSAVVRDDLDAFLGVAVPPVVDFAVVIRVAGNPAEAAVLKLIFATCGARAYQIAHRSGGLGLTGYRRHHQRSRQHGCAYNPTFAHHSPLLLPSPSSGVRAKSLTNRGASLLAFVATGWAFGAIGWQNPASRSACRANSDGEVRGFVAPGCIAHQIQIDLVVPRRRNDVLEGGARCRSDEHRLLGTRRGYIEIGRSIAGHQFDLQRLPSAQIDREQPRLVPLDRALDRLR